MEQMVFDVVVIGAGIGGLCSAALLCQKGYKVLIVERLTNLGGRCTSFNCKGFKVSTGAFWIPVGGRMEEVFNEVGADFEVVVASQMDTIYRIEGEDFNLSHGRGAFRRMIDKVADSSEETDRVLSSLKTTPADGRETIDQWIRNITDNQKLHGLFQMISRSFIGSNSSECLISDLLSVITYKREQYGFADNAKLIKSLSARIRDNGGTIRPKTKVERIVLEKGKAIAIDTIRKEKGVSEKQRLQAKFFISDIGPKQTLRLLGEANLDENYARLVEENSKPLTTLIILISSKVPLIDTKGIFVPYGMKRVAYLTSPSNVLPELAPTGKQLIEVSCKPLVTIDAHHSLKEKRKEKEIALEEIKTILRGFEEHCEVLSMMWFEKDWPGTRKCLAGGYHIPQETPIDNLFNVGDGTSIQGVYGYPLNVCAQSAEIVVNKICGKDGR